MSGARVLLVEDTPQMRKSVSMILGGHGYDVAQASSGEEALQEFARRLPDVILLDLMLPDIGGLDVCRRVRERSSVPIIVLSARGDETTKVEALDLGADDYLTKPFGAKELLARVRVALRHAAGASGTSLEAADIVMDLLRRTVTVRGESVALTPREYDLLKFLLTHRGRVLTHTVILREVWGSEYVAETQYLRNVVLSLRRKVEAEPSRPGVIVTEPGVGYRVQVED
jgi:two-component system KDP operon response regulator KdpE